MLSRFFIDRPIFANVIAIITVLLGIVFVNRLPIEQYPQITPPTVKVTTVYPGGNAKVIADTVAAPIEQQVNGVEKMLYMQSTSASDGTYNLTVTFDVGTNLDIAQVLVQNRVAIAQPQLPEDVRRQGITTKKVSTAIILVVSLTSKKGPDGKYVLDDLFLANFGLKDLRDELSRVDGVGDVNVAGATSYGMRIWLDPDKLRALSLTTQEVVQALQEQNVQVAAGQIGQPPAPNGQSFQYTVETLGRLKEPEQFEEIIVRTGNDGRYTRLRDVGRVELGGQSYDQFARVKGSPAASLVVYQLPGANALDVATRVRAKMTELEAKFKTQYPDVVYTVPFDTTKFVDQAIHEVYRTLIEAGLLVLVVILFFLQDWRAVLVPATTVPVTIVGAFAFLYALGFTINLLTLFGLVLAIGIVVDDAIVIVENAAHHIEMGESPRDGTIKAMDEVTGPVIGITLVLMAVFVPSAFMTGITGQLNRQFALTIAATALISAVNAVTLKPVQCATYLKPKGHKARFFLDRWVSAALEYGIGRWFNPAFNFLERLYVWVIRWVVKLLPVSLAVYLLVAGATAWWYTRIPTGFLPTEDQGYIITVVQLPDAASLERTAKVVDEIEGILGKTDGIDTWFVLGGFSLFDGAANSNSATIFAVFKPWKDREGPEQSQEAILGKLNGAYFGIREANVFCFPPPAIQGLGNSGGFEMQVQYGGDGGLDQLQQVVADVQQAAAPAVAPPGVNTTFRATVPQVYADIDRTKVKTLDLNLGDVFGTLQTFLGSAYVNDFNKFNRTYQVRVQADHQFRNKVEDINRLQVRNRQGKMVPLSTVVKAEEIAGSQIVSRYNLLPAALLTGSAPRGESSGQALNVMEQVTDRTLPPGMYREWTGMSFQEKRAGGAQALYIFGVAVLLVYLVLAAQYESWVLPAAVILVVPLGLIGTVAALAIRGMDNNAYTQIGIILIIALASKNAILIVEFARELRQREGKSITEAAVEASRSRFRPILMTSFAFILGVFPLVRAEGAGAASRQALGTAVFGGMITSTILAVFFVPAFYVVFQWLSELGGKLEPSDKNPLAAEPPESTQKQPAGEPLKPAGGERH